ncbi:E3 ubiquitin-protein ligase UPL5-like [Gastrolobium bilobum]|uniref:E3 ubiquitin-protein ligase UPL5-like n=1 Tax=Gastrolobium bilobum TaxID=150636 RepID=UPI002AB280A4|nr:E3 ubiquitin-protein ligase UPL5-like [Gastrolobium bilobum]
MSIIETPTVDCDHDQRGGVAPTDYYRHSAKRKFDDFTSAFDDYDDCADFLDLVSVRMKKDVEANAVVNSSSAAASRLQFFVRMISKGNSMVMQGFPQDTVKSIHERIETMTGIPVCEQRLIYNGKQLRWKQTLHECGIQNDANLQLVGNLRSGMIPKVMEVIDNMISLICRLCRGEVVHDALEVIKILMTKNFNVPGYFEAFLSSKSPAILVMLYVSPHAGNKGRANCSIMHFLSWCHTKLSKSFYRPCARVVLELCKVLRRVVGCDDPLYISCRSAFGFLLENGSVSYGSGNPKSSILLQDICPFVRELANTLLRDLDLSISCPTSTGPFSTDVRDFTALLIPLRTGIREQQALEGSVTDGKCCQEDPLLAEEVDYLRLIYIQLLSKMDECLRGMEECLANKEQGEGDNVYLGWYQYLSILKELHQISKLYDGAEEKFWRVLMHRRNMLSLLIIRHAKRTDDHQWILEHKSVTNFESRRHLAMLLFPEVKEDYEEFHEMLIDRSKLLAESFEYITGAKPESLHAGLFMEFKNEEATGPGVLREWFVLVCQAIFNPQNALFVACPNDCRRFFPNPASKVHPLHLEYFSFSGRIIALALMNRVHVGIVFDRAFFMQLAGNYITLEDIRDADPYLYSSCKQILEMDADFIDSDALGLTFVREVEELGYRKVVELCPGGKRLVVNSKNREKYVDLLIQNRFVTSISEQVSHFAKGFDDILSNSRLRQFFQSLDLEDLDWMLHGSENTTSVEDWKAHTEYNGYKETDGHISWFWEIVGRMSAEQRKVLLFFWTSVKYLPVEGFHGLGSRLYICRSLEPEDRLPSSHTCFYQLCLPPYSSMAVMQDRLGVITQDHIGCSFGTW